MSHVEISVKTAVYPIVYVANEIMNTLIRIVDRRGLSMDYINRHRETLLDGIFTWLSTRHLEKLVLEIYNGETVIERHDLNFSYSKVVPSTTHSKFETNLRKLEDFLSKLPSLEEGLQYRVVVVLKEGAPDVPGWKPTRLRPVDHLRHQNLGDLIKADYIGVAFEYWGR